MAPAAIPPTSIATSPDGTSTFHQFARLPIELRLKIWRLALPGPRTLKILVENIHIPRPNGAGTEMVGRCFPTTEARKVYDIPALLLVCKESRAETQTLHTLCFHSALHGKPIYVNYSRDTVYFESGFAIFSFFPKPEGFPVAFEGLEKECAVVFDKLKHIIVGEVLIAGCYHTIAKMKELQSFIVNEQTKVKYPDWEERLYAHEVKWHGEGADRKVVTYETGKEIEELWDKNKF